jgi:predicted site-specific integrase-resolvase
MRPRCARVSLTIQELCDELDPLIFGIKCVLQMSRTNQTSLRRVGYARVSTKSQDLSCQLRALKAQRCHKIFSDAASGKSLVGRPKLRKAIEALAPGDELVIAEWDRAARSMWDGL